MTYQAQSARDAQRIGYGGESYWDYLEETAMRHRDYYAARGMIDDANRMMSRTLSESFAGNDGD